VTNELGSPLLEAAALDAKRLLGERFGGAWFDLRGTGVVIGAVSPTQTEIATLLSNHETAWRVLVCRFSAQELLVLQERLGRRLRSLPPAARIISIDYEANRVGVLVQVEDHPLVEALAREFPHEPIAVSFASFSLRALEEIG
jgi:hypothetical protein